MGRSYMPTYRLEFNDGATQVQAWKGKATAGALRQATGEVVAEWKAGMFHVY